MPVFFYIVQKLIMFFISKNILQCESALQTNKKKRKASDAFKEDYDYLLGIVTTATEWYFLLYTSEGILCTSQMEYYIRLTRNIAKEENEAELRKNVKRVMEVIVCLLKNRVEEVGKEPATKKQRIEKYRGKK